MDPSDYVALETFIRAATGHYQAPRSPIQAVHDYPVQPSWNTVLVLYDCTPMGKDGRYDHDQTMAAACALVDYCPAAEFGYMGSPRKRYHQGFKWMNGAPDHVYTGEDSWVKALDQFVGLLAMHAQQERDNLDPAKAAAMPPPQVRLPVH